ncbi:hypothetical protein J6590_092128 [Homalodisca vitripennis]|nr:hypothetical protein J6590_092128 [Homalodisca vitripennis]
MALVSERHHPPPPRITPARGGTDSECNSSAQRRTAASLLDACTTTRLPDYGTSETYHQVFNTTLHAISAISSLRFAAYTPMQTTRTMLLLLVVTVKECKAMCFSVT